MPDALPYPYAPFPVPAPMRAALSLAEGAARSGEVPVGAVVTQPVDGIETVIAVGANRTRGDHDPTAHAEMVAIRAACARLRTDRLIGCTLWVTLEPCAMCAGAIAHARLARLVFAAPDPKGGGVAHGPQVFSQPTCHHRPEILGEVGADAAARLLTTFFAALR